MTTVPKPPAAASPISAASLSSAPSSANVLNKLFIVAGDIKISHTVFALPFALLSTFLAAYNLPGHAPFLGQIGLVVLCMATARTIAMAANRLLDARLDQLNPRTARRAIPSGQLSRTFYVAVVAVCTIGFFAGCAAFWAFFGNALPTYLGLPVLLFLCGYPFLKRFSRLCHYYLGTALALAPVCAWVAIRGSIDAPPLWMAGAVLCWTAGFDIIYACQDYASDVATGVFSVPAKLGIAKALWVAKITHVLSVSMLVMLGLSAQPPLATLYFIGVGLAALLLIIEHAIVKPDDLSKVGLAFFTVNGVISVILGTLGILDVFF